MRPCAGARGRSGRPGRAGSARCAGHDAALRSASCAPPPPRRDRSPWVATTKPPRVLGRQPARADARATAATSAPPAARRSSGAAPPCARAAGRRPPAPGVEAEVMVVPAGRHERRGAEVRLHLEAEHVAVEARAPRSRSPTCRCRWPDAQARADRVRRLLAARRSPAGTRRRAGPGPPVAQVGRPGARAGGRRPARCRCRPRRAGRSPRACRGRTRPATGVRVAIEAARRARQLLPARVEQRVVVEARVAPGGRARRVLVQHDDGLGAVAQLRRGALAAVHAQPQRALVPGDGAVEVGDREVDRAEPQRRRQRRVAHAATRTARQTGSHAKS